MKNLSAGYMQYRAERLLKAARLSYTVFITGSDENFCDPSIDIEGMTIAAVEIDIPKLGGTITVQGFQLYAVEYIPSYRPSNGDPGDPPSEDLKELGEPHRNFDDAVIEAAKLLIENDINLFRESKDMHVKVVHVDVDKAEYIGSNSDGVYVQADEGPEGWYVSGVVDSDTGHFVDDLFVRSWSTFDKGRCIIK